MTPELLQAFAQWPIVGVVLYVAARWIGSIQTKAEERAKNDREAIEKKEAECAAERKEAAAQREAMMREMLSREMAVRDRELAGQTKVIADNAQAMLAMATAIAKNTETVSANTAALVSRKSVQNMSAVGR